VNKGVGFSNLENLKLGFQVKIDHADLEWYCSFERRRRVSRFKLPTKPALEEDIIWALAITRVVNSAAERLGVGTIPAKKNWHQAKP
jgi:hypothetical protein